ncbi:InlB B-repeat-containing protein, partial [Candidatus Saccharibacteria bacterium]|nr:InlB B-repeat-containing protein [Candidatus Saccharibacteria bacterium]
MKREVEEEQNHHFVMVRKLGKPGRFSHFAFILLGAGFCIASLNLFFIYNFSNFVSASTYSATITAPDISLNVSPMGDGANVTTNNITVDSTCPYGYTVSISGPSDTTLYKDGDNTSSYTINTSSGTKLAPTSIIGANVGTWGYSTLAGTTASSSNFIGLTNEVSELFSKETASATGGDVLPVYYGASITSSTPPGAYTMADSANTGKITYILTPSENCSSYLVAFNPTSTASGTEVSGTGTMNSQRIYEGIATSLTPNAFTAPEGYTFTGWNTAQDGTGIHYADEASVTDLITVGQTITLYAEWEEDDPPLYLQSVQDSDCTTNTVTTAVDRRDREEYHIKRLADGHCWMLENLRLGSDSRTYSLNSRNTNVEDPFTLPVATAAFPGDTVYDAAINVSNRDTLVDQVFGEGSGKIGTYYNYCAATGGTQCDGNSADDATRDICPRAWRLPTGGSGATSEQQTLLDSYGSYATYMPGAALTLSGFFDQSSGSVVSNLNSEGYFWSATHSNSTNEAYFMNPTTSSSSMGSGLERNGMSVRCLLDLSNVPRADIVTTVTFDSGVSSIQFSSVAYGTQTITTSGDTITLKEGIAYDMIPTFVSGKAFNAWTTSNNGTLGNASSPNTTFTASYNYALAASLSLSSKESEELPCAAGYICYHPNHADATGGGIGTMSDQAAASNSSADLVPPNYSRAGYGFAGWNTQPDGFGTTYGPNATIVTGDLSTNGLSLYAKWVESSGSLQTWTGCAELPVTTTANAALGGGSIVALTDNRDNQVYTVAKLADNKCWTLENLRLDPSTATINNQNTHDPADGFAAAAAVSSSSNSLCGTDGDATCNNKLQYNTNSLNRSLTQSYNTAGNNVAWYSYGVHYNWYTATAGHGTTNTTGGATVTGDICPIGWHLPTGNNGEFVALNTAINPSSDTGLRDFPANFLWSGDYNRTSRTNGYTNGRYWSSTGFDTNNAYRFGFQPNNVTANGNYRKWDAFAVRCIYDGERPVYDTVTVTLDSGVNNVTFTHPVYGTQTVTSTSNTVTLRRNAEYTITMNPAAGYELDSWVGGANSTIGSSVTNPTTFTETGATTLTVNTQAIPSYTVTVNLDAHAHSVGFYNNVHGTAQVVNDGSGSGGAYTGTVTLYRGVVYTLSSSFDSGYIISGWTTTANGTLGSTTSPATTYVVTGDATLDLASKEARIYDMVADQVKKDGSGNEKTQTSSDLQATITTNNSGVYKYDATTFGASSDASNDRNIYYYRGILDSDSSDYGSSGDGVLSPNYVILDGDGTKTTSDTCWRILRTTGSGGVKLIYNGRWTGSTCANNYSDAQTSSLGFNGTSSTYRQVVRVGYTYNNNYATNSAYTTTIANVFGTNADPSVNNTDSNIKNYLENTWFSNINGYEYILEPSAGYCNDRTLNTSSGWTTPLTESNNITTYGTSSLAALYFGPYPRNYTTSQLPSLTCAKYSNVDRSTVDLYTTGVALDGNKQLSKPVALLTADEASFAGSGNYSGSSYDAKSFLYTGNAVWSLSPGYRSSSGLTYNSTLYYGGYQYASTVYSSYGVRPVISLVSGIRAASGSGTAIDPWVVKEPASYSNTVNFDEHVSSVSFTDLFGNTQTATPSSPTVSLKEGVQYTINATIGYGYEFNSWSTGVNGVLASTSANPTTYSVSGANTLTVASQIIPSYQVTVNLDQHSHSVSFYNEELGTQTVVNNNGNGDGTETGTVSLKRDAEYTITATFDAGFRMDYWTTGANGTLGSITDNPTTYVVTNTSTLSLTSEDVRLIINYEGNGLYYNNDPTDTVNTVTYYNTKEDTTNSYTRYSHTPNVGDDGVKNYNYSNNYTKNEVVTIDGATSLHIRLTWGGESDTYDWVSFWEGSHSDYTALNNYSSGVKCGSNTSGKYGGGTYTSASNTVECDIPGDTVTFAYRSDVSQVGDGYGYYAVVTGDVVTQTGDFYSISENYAVPSMAGGHTFLGWSEDQNATVPTYANEADIIANSGYVRGDSPVTLYAVYGLAYTVTVNMDEHVSSVGFYNEDYGTQTASSSGDTVALYTKITYTISGSYDSDYKFDVWTTSANGILGSTTDPVTDYEVSGAATLSLASKDVLALYDYECPANKICYAPNTRDIDGSMSTINTTTLPDYPTAGVQNAGSNGNYTLIASNYSRDGYGFVGWSEDFYASDSSTIYGPTETITTGDLSAHGMILYPVWVASAGDMQNWSGCGSLPQSSFNSTTGKMNANLSSVTALTDQRDDNTYAVARLADGNCWMIENLRINAEDTRGNTNKALAQGYSNNIDYGSFIGLADSEDSNFGNSSTANSLYSTNGANDTMNINSSSSPQYRIPRYNNKNTDRNLTASYNSMGQWYGYGNYYNWPASMANTIYYNGPTSTDANNKTSDTVGTSICPADWQLPYGNTTGKGANVGGFSYLDTQLGGTGANSSSSVMSNRWRSFPNNFISAGMLSWSSTSYRGGSGYYYSSTSYDSQSAYGLSFANGSVSLSSSNSKANGASVRCMMSVPLVVVNVSMDSHISKITFSDSSNNPQVATASNPVVNLRPDFAYTVTATIDTTHELTNWTTTTGGTVDSTVNNPTTYTVTGATTLSATSQARPDYTVTVNMDQHVSSVGFYNADLGFQQVTTTGGTVSLKRGVDYIVAS